MEQPTNPFDGVLIEHPVPEFKVCSICKTPKPAEEFYLDNSGGTKRSGRCIECRRANRYMGPKRDRLRDGIKQLVAAACHSTVKLPDIAEVPTEMIRLFGGVTGFVQEWKNQIDLAKEGSKTRLDQMHVVFKMLAAAAADRREQADLTTVSEDELEEAIAGYVYRVIHPGDAEEEPEAGESNVA